MPDDEREQYASQTWTINGEVYTEKIAADEAQKPVDVKQEES